MLTTEENVKSPLKANT